jgi:hypothetical protein
MSVVLPASPPQIPVVPWSRRDAGLLAVVLAVGAVLVGLSWFFAAGRADAGDQLAFVSLALVGTALGLAGVVGWTVHGRRAINLRRSRLLGTAPPAPSDAAQAVELVAGPTGRWFHRADCLLVDGRGWAASARREHESAGRLACPGCRP